MNKIKIGIVTLFCCVIIGSLTIFASNEPVTEKNAVTPELDTTSTIPSIAQITLKHLMENAILDIQVIPVNEKEQVLLKLQTTEFLTEDVLQKNTYNMLQDLSQLDTLDQITIAWYMLIDNNNTEVLTITLDATALTQVTAMKATELPTWATAYKKHEMLQVSR